MTDSWFPWELAVVTRDGLHEYARHERAELANLEAGIAAFKYYSFCPLLFLWQGLGPFPFREGRSPTITYYELFSFPLHYILIWVLLLYLT